ncbi:hypothetical protein SLE2022_072540 [Rubroshorea leprosula]
MEPLLGFEDAAAATDGEEISSSSSSNGYKLVPWLSWDEWEDVRKSLFSTSPDKIAFALNRISTWRSRGCLPVVIDVTASIIEIQQKDPFFRGEGQKDDLYSEQMLAMLYCMAILRLVNCVVEKTRKQREISIADAAEAIGIPRILIDVRHEGSHRDLPALVVVRDSSIMALNWLKSYYWEPQRKQIPFQKDETSNIRREIKSKVRELAFCLKVNQSPELRSLLGKEKRSGHHAHHCGRNKFFSFMAGKVHSSKLGGSKKQISKTLKTLASLYASFSSELVSVLLEFLLKALDSSNVMNLPKDSQACQDLHTLLDDWKLVITKFSSKEPELILALLQRILDIVGTKEDTKYGMGEDVMLSENRSEISHVERLSYLFAWLVGYLKELKLLNSKDSSGKNLSKVLIELLRKSLLVSASGNSHIMHSALQLVQLLGDSFLMKKLNKLCLLSLSGTDVSEGSSLLMSYKNLSQEEESISQASKKLELIKLQRMKNKAEETKVENVGNPQRWVVAKSWNPCPIGMLPRVLGSSGYLPVLDCGDGSEVLRSSEEKNWELNQCGCKRKASPDIEVLDNSSPKKARETTEESHESDGGDVSSTGVGSRLLIDTVWKQVREEELQARKSAVRILI